MADFGQANSLLQKGKHVRRRCWNEGEFMFYTPSVEAPYDLYILENTEYKEIIDKAKALGTHDGKSLKINGHIDFISSTGTITVGHTLTQMDLLAVDWEEYRVEEE